jgi:hypothetical protein
MQLIKIRKIKILVDVRHMHEIEKSRTISRQECRGKEADRQTDRQTDRERERERERGRAREKAEGASCEE